MIDASDSTRAALTLLFAPGQRPAADAIVRLQEGSGAEGRFRVSLQPDADEGWLELLTMGLAYDLTGLAPRHPAPAVPPRHFYGLREDAIPPDAEALRLQPGPHLAFAGGLLPVARIQVSLGLALARLPGLIAVCWEAAHTAMSSAHFSSIGRAWLADGPFPALGLTALVRKSDGAIESEGLRLFCGFELRIEPEREPVPGRSAKLALRAIDQLVAQGPDAIDCLTGPDGVRLQAELAPDRGIVRIWPED